MHLFCFSFFLNNLYILGSREISHNFFSHSIFFPFFFPSVQFSRFTKLCDRYHYLSPGHVHHSFPQHRAHGKLPPTFPFPCSYPLVTTNSFCRYEFVFSYKWNHTVEVFCVWLLALRITISRVIHGSSFLWLNDTLLYLFNQLMDIMNFFSTSWLFRIMLLLDSHVQVFEWT